jgi:pimeloyl-ACP methyl ester carboxylesterase
MNAELQMENHRSPADAARIQLLDNIPVTEGRMQLAGIPTAVLEGGDGPPLILLHGPGEFAAKWLRVIPELVATHHVIAPDLPGHGRSEVGRAELDAERVLLWLGELIERTCSSPPVLVGHVLGGAIAARFAIRHGGLVKQLVLVDSLGLAPFRPSPRFALAMVHFLALPAERTYDRFMRQCSYDLDGLREELGERWGPFVAYNLDLIRTPSVKNAVRTLMCEVGLAVISPEDLARISIPTTLVWGRHDRANRLRIAEDASARYGWPLHVIDDCADDPARDRPEEFLEVLRSVLELTSIMTEER